MKKMKKGTNILLLISNPSTNGVFKNGVDIVTLDSLAMPSNFKMQTLGVLGYSFYIMHYAVYTVYRVPCTVNMQFNFTFARNK